jgi:hypothetical protein
MQQTIYQMPPECRRATEFRGKKLSGLGKPMSNAQESYPSCWLGFHGRDFPETEKKTFFKTFFFFKRRAAKGILLCELKKGLDQVVRPFVHPLWENPAFILLRASATLHA